MSRVGWNRKMAAALRLSTVIGLVLAAIGIAFAAPVAAQQAEPVAGSGIAHYPLKNPEQQSWSFAGLFGHYDPAQLQRGFQVYKEVCSNCHSLRFIAFRNLGDAGGPHFSDEAVKALAASYKIADGPNEAGEMFDRPGKPSDRLPSPFPNEQAAAAANGGAVPPDLSLIAKSRAVERGVLFGVLDFFTQYQEAGPDYIHALLTGFQDPPAGAAVPPNTHYNPYFMSALSLAMPPPLSDGQVTYSDGSPQTVDQYARDVAAFLMWAAEPHLVDRKRMGFEVLIFLIIFTGLMYLTKKKVWAAVAH
jgi:ubiquinol-cytochrome c reductase cytochrome c1 subunit